MSSYFQNKLAAYVVKGIENSPETMEFLREQISIIFNEEKQHWLRNQGDDEIDKEFFCEYYNSTERKAIKYLSKWLTDLSRQGGFKINNCPHSIVSSFDYMIDECLDYIMEDVSYSLSSKITDELINEEEKNYEALNLSKNGVPK